MTSRPFRFGVQTAGASSAREWLDLARRAEDAGYAVLSLPDHLGEQLAPLPALTAAATATERLRLGTWVLANDFRHPVMLAKEAATLDLLSDGRLELGVGAGWMETDYATSGIPHDSARVRIERLAETVRLLRGLWDREPFDFAGRHYRVSALDGQPKPLQRPGPPLAIGGGGRRILELAGREADIVGLGMRLSAGRIDPAGGRTITADATDRKVDWVRAAAATGARDPELNARVFNVRIGPAAEREAATLGAPIGLEPDELLASPHALIGSPEHAAEQLHAARERWGISYFTVSRDALEPLAPLVGRLSGC